MIFSPVLTQITRVTDGRTDGIGVEYTRYAVAHKYSCGICSLHYTVRIVQQWYEQSKVRVVRESSESHVASTSNIVIETLHLAQVVYVFTQASIVSRECHGRRSAKHLSTA